MRAAGLLAVTRVGARGRAADVAVGALAVACGMALLWARVRASALLLFLAHHVLLAVECSRISYSRPVTRGPALHSDRSLREPLGMPPARRERQLPANALYKAVALAAFLVIAGLV